MGASRAKYVFDELHGFIELGPGIVDIVDSPAFQRLRRVKQLAQAWLVYPGAVHTRFSHSLGVMRVMDQLASRLVREGHVSEDYALVLRLAALLHDIGHTPYSHALEMFFHNRYRLRHEELGRYVIENDPAISEKIKELGADPREVAAIVGGVHSNVTLNMLMSSDLDADRLDYLMRDALHTGVVYGRIDVDRIVSTLTVTADGRLAVPMKAIHAVESFYIARLHMYRAVYYHKTITSYQLLMETIYELLANDPDTSPLLEPYTTPEGIKRAVRDGTFFAWDDYYIGGLLNYVVSHRIGGEVLRELAGMYLKRRGLRAVLNETYFTSVPEEEARIRERARELEEELMMKGVSSTYVRVYYDTVPILEEDEQVVVLHDSGEEPISGLKSSIIGSLPKSMVVLRVYAHPRYAGVAWDIVRKVTGK